MTKLVITVATGDEGQRLHAVTGPGQRDYANRCGADYIAITGTPSAFPVFDKFLAYGTMLQYDRVMWIDADAFVARSCPSLFDLYPTGSIYWHDDTPWHGGHWDYRGEVTDVCMSQNEPVPDNFRLYNAGVVLFDSSNVDIWEPPTTRLPLYWAADQHLETVRALNRGYSIKSLPRRFNWMWWIDRQRPDPMAHEAQILHCSGFTLQGGDPSRRVAWLQMRVDEEREGVPFFEADRAIAQLKRRLS